MNNSRSPEKDPAGQTRLVGWALSVFGTVCATLSVVLVLTGVQMAFIDGPTMFLFSGGMVMTGVWQIHLAKKIESR